MANIENPLEIIKSLGGDTRSGACRCPVAGHGKGRGDMRPSLWVSPEGKGLKCKAGCTYKSIVAAIRARGIKVRYEGRRSTSTKPKMPPINVDLDAAQRFLDLIDPNAEAWTFQTFDDDHERGNKKLANICHGTLKEQAAELKRKSRYGAGTFVCLQRTDAKGRKAENVEAIRAVSVDLDGAPLAPVHECELKPHAIIASSPGRHWAHWAVKDLPLAEFEGIVRGIANRFGGDPSIAELSHCARLPGFEHAKIPTKRFQVRIVEANEGPPYTAAEIRKVFPSVAKRAGAPKIESPTLKAQRERSAALADKYISRDGGPPKLSPEVESKLGELADLHPFDYERERKEAAKDMGVRAETLDKEVERRREERAVLPFLEDEEPWHEPVNGSELLGEITETIARYVDMPKSAALACSLWAVLTHVHDAFYISPILGITSPAMQCGKTTLLAMLQGVTRKALPGSNWTGAVIFRAVDLWSPTLLIDEADTYLNRDDLRGILDSGHNRTSAFVLRCDGDSLEPRAFSTWAPKAIARIGKLAPTLADRSIPIALKRKPPDTDVERQPRDPKAAFQTLRRKCIRWADDNVISLSKAETEVPEVLGFRAQDSWEPLLAIADACGPGWGERARAAAIKLSASARHIGNSQSLGVLLLEDIRDIFDEHGIETTPKTGKPYKAIASEGLAARLAEREDRPWVEFGRSRKPITPRGIASLLEGFQIRPKEMPSGANGYRDAQFVHAFKRYLSPDRRINAENQRVPGDSILGTTKPKPEDKKARKRLGIREKPKIRG